jgi:protein-disulfide isomerase
MHTTTFRALLAACLLFVCLPALPAADGTQLRLPAGVDLAIVVFEDLQCPDCARAHPELLEASSKLGVPLLIHDFPIKRHVWAFPAAVLARYFAAQSPALGAGFRDFVFHEQRGITADNLRQFGERFAQERGVELPADVDPDGRYAAGVQADYDLGEKIGLEYVPLIFVIARDGDGSRAVEVTDRDKLRATVEALRSGRMPQPEPQSPG